jgi:hypothetical protein
MKKLCSFALFCCLLHAAGAQIDFKPGFVISRDGQYTECLVEDEGWKNNPFTFRYRLQPDGPVLTGDLDNTLAFGVKGESRYERWELNVDLTLDGMLHLSRQRAPEYVRDTLFLRLLVEGDVKLYYYETTNIQRFFLGLPGETPRQLVYKTYWASSDKVAENSVFRRQLEAVLTCNGNAPDLSNLAYTRRQLLKAYEQYYACNDKAYTVYRSFRDSITFHARALAGLSMGTSDFESGFLPRQDLQYRPGSAYRIGAELELVTSYQKRKWSLLAEPALQFYHDREVPIVDVGEVNFQLLELWLGLRHYFYRPDHSAFYATASLALLNAPVRDLGVVIDGRSASFRPNRPNLYLAAGYRHRGRLSAEVRYAVAKRPLLSLRSYFAWSDCRVLSLLIGYRLF